ncbi:hypothetical protein C0J52_04175 [Blattella germanica]|nr:hypothetical protein C0J52_04175 [Blattella germanica]
MSSETETRLEETYEHQETADSKFAPAVHVIAAIHFWLVYFYDRLYIKYPIQFQLRFLTYWNVLLQAAYFIICVGNYFYGSNGINPRPVPLIRQVRDYVYAAVAFPVAMFVGMEFWMLMCIDRELIFPRALDAIVPNWLNHAIHTNIMIFTLLEMVTSFRKYPNRSKGLAGLTAFMATYGVWLHIIYAVSGSWVYPVLNVVNWWQRVIFFLFALCLVLGLYFIGELVNTIVWGEILQKLEAERTHEKTKYE